MNVVVCWSGMQGYFASCLRALNKVPGINLHVFYLNFNDVPAQEELLSGVRNERLQAADNRDITDAVASLNPDLVFLCGWFYGPYRALAHEPRLSRARFVLGMDTPWVGSWQQRMNQVRLKRFMARMDRVIAAGGRSAEFARRIDGTPGKVVTGLYGFDFSTFCDAGSKRFNEAAWPRKFLFAGRYAPEKGLAVLMEAYQRYRASVQEPWPLHCCGSGPQAALLKREGVHDMGYVLPTQLPKIFADHGVFVMPSLEEPWGVAIAEAAATGLPLICTDVCGAAADLLRSYYNGIAVPPNDAAALASALRWMHHNHHRLPSFGERGRHLAQPFSADVWAERVHACFSDVLNGRP